MERSDIVRKFLAEGYQLAADALEYLAADPDKVQPFISIVKGMGGKPVITKSLIEELLGGVSPKVRVLKSFASSGKETSVGQISDRLSRRYQKISELLSKRAELQNLISINRVKEETDQKFSVIGIVREINPGDRTIVVEDMTGSTAIYIADDAAGDFPYLVEDEVIGLVCDSQEWVGKRATRIVFPDVPLSTKISTSKSDTLCLFLSDVHIDEPGFQPRSYEKLGEYLKKIKGDVIVFVLGDVSADAEKSKRFLELFPENFSVMTLTGHAGDEKNNNLPDPVEVEIDGVKIFLSHGDMFQKYFEKFKTSPENMLLQMLKKRHLSPTFGSNPDLDDEKLLIEDVPDIFVIGHYHDPRILNHKGVTMISLGSFVAQPVFWMVNLKTRETIKVDLT